MSYCVNCGVELDKSAKKCALCSTPVINPNIVLSEKAEKPFSDELHIPKAIKKKFIAYIITVIILIPNIVLFFVNLLFFHQQHWSLYILTTSSLVWILFVFPFFTKKIKPYLLWFFDSLAVTAYVYFFFLIGNELKWMLKCTFSIIFIISVMSLIFIIWSRKKSRHWSAVVIHLLTDLSLIFLLSGSIISIYSNNANYLYIGLMLTLCSIALLGFFIYCNRSKHMREWLKKVFFV